jgi:hypothetical protein
MPKFSLLASICCLLVIAGACALSLAVPVEPELALAESTFAGMVATGVAIALGRFPI